jgi:hypothetical protein
MLERIWTLFTDRSDEPCSGYGSRVALRYLGGLGTVLPTSAASEAGP